MPVLRLTYRACALGGPALGIAVAALFAARAGLTPLLWVAAAAFAVCAALFLAAMTKVLTGEESFSFLHYQLATAGATLLMLPEALGLLGLALAIAQAVGRLGCASAGCCHGRVGRVRVQYVESAALLLIAALAAATLDFAVYALAYAAARFVLEYFRRDLRRRFLRMSEAQWICAATAAAIFILRGTS